MATLPVGIGGLGIRRATDLAIPAFIASSLAARSLCIVLYANDTPLSEKSLTDAASIWENEGLSWPNGGETVTQKWMDTLKSERRFEALVSSNHADAHRSALLKANSASHAGAWLHAIPSRTLV